MRRTTIAAALCCMSLASGAFAANDASGSNATSPATGSSSSSMNRDTTGSMSGGSSSTMGMSSNADAQTVRQVQQALSNKGHDPGPVDGVMGPRTRAALQSYQRSQNLSGASGLDQRTLESLGVQANASGMRSGDSGSSAGGSGSAAGGSGGSTDMNRNSTSGRPGSDATSRPPTGSTPGMGTSPGTGTSGSGSGTSGTGTTR